MTFTTSLFLFGLLPWFILLIYITRKHNNLKKYLVLLANSVFCVWGGVGTLIFLCVYSLVVYWLGIGIKRLKKKAFLFFAIMITITPLIAVKYMVIIVEYINIWLGRDMMYCSLAVPIGLSFFSFEAVSLLVDIYNEKITQNVSYLDTYMYMTFFPTVTSGPITRFNTFKRGLINNVDISYYGLAMERIVLGLCKKTLVADKLVILADYYFDGIAEGHIYSCAGLWTGSIAYTLQLYFDFSGYSDMAIGIARLLGFDLAENFNKPYRAKSISEFWRRWHISLSQWFRDYIYIPLGGNRCPAWKHIGNLFVVWILTGIWHGADLSFVVWGLGYFLLLVVEKYISGIKRRICSGWIGHFYTLMCVNLLWVPFRADNITVAGKYIAGMFGIDNRGYIEEKALSYLPFLGGIVILCVCPWEKYIEKYREKVGYGMIKGILVLLLAFLAFCAVIGSTYNPYIYGGF